MHATRANRERGKRIRKHIIDILSAENSESHFTDMVIARQLRTLGIDTTPGNVTYHRRQLGIAGSATRRKKNEETHFRGANDEAV